jgi:glycosyltransferase involved in cell wall biosynthesis
MASVLIVNVQVPWPLEDGNALRVYQLARHASPGHDLHLACLPARAESRQELADQGVFGSVTLLPPVPHRRHWRRFLRRGNDSYHRLTYPDHHAACVRMLQEIVRREQVEIVVATLSLCAEFVRPLRGVARVVDQYDSATLAIERELAFGIPGLRRRWSRRRSLAAARQTEAALGRHAELLTAISPADCRRLRELNAGNGCPVELVPNGVDLELTERPDALRPERGVAFWGNLSFPVNRMAVMWFYREVWEPRLRPQGVRWAIVGPHADAGIRDLAARHPEIEVPGFVPDLFGYLDRFPVMVNPMVTGAGLKNKTLEALAVGMAVVSTRLGVDALEVRDGEHALLADDPAAFGDAVLTLLDDARRRADLAAGARRLVRQRYSWEAVASSWSVLLEKYGGVQSR